MKTLLSLAFLIGSGLCVDAQTTQVTRIELTSRGVFGGDVQKQVEEPGSASGSKTISANLKLLESTIRIPARFGIRFGYEFIVIGRPQGAEVSLKFVTIFPPEGLLNPQTRERTYRNELMGTRIIGQPTYRGYYLNNDWEVLPGEWVFQIWDADRKLLEQRFTLYRP